MLPFPEFTEIGMCQMGSVNHLKSTLMSLSSVGRLSNEVSTEGFCVLKMTFPGDL